jgi:hypothetical protein
MINKFNAAAHLMVNEVSRAIRFHLTLESRFRPNKNAEWLAVSH